MATIAVDKSNTTEIITAGDRALNRILGADGMRVYINYHIKEAYSRSHMVADMIEEAMKEGEAMIAELSASYGGRRGDYTKERHERPSRTHEEVSADIKRIQAEWTRREAIPA